MNTLQDEGSTTNPSPAPRPPVVLPPERQQSLGTWGVTVKVLLTAADTGGRYGVIEYVAPPTGLGPPLHLHREMEESFHMQEGTIHFRLGDQTVAAGPGTFVHVPAGVPHAFWNEGPGPARYFGTFAPGGFENYFAELCELAEAHPAPTLDIRPLIAQLGDKYDVVVVGPPPGAAGRG